MTPTTSAAIWATFHTHRRHVGQEELAVAVEHAQAPRRQHEEPDAREHDAGQLDREVVLLAVEARGQDRGQRLGEQDADQADARR